MKKLRKYWISISVLAGLATAFVGHKFRDWVEIGPPVAANAELTSLLASKDGSVQAEDSEAFLHLVELLKNQYVEPITDEDKLAYGAVKGMIGSLVNPDTNFMDPTEFRAFREAEAGVYQGIGVELKLAFTPEQLKVINSKVKTSDIVPLLPKLVVTMVAPGSTAEKAGLKPGDRITSADGKWIMAAEPILEFRELEKAFKNGKVPADQVTKARIKLQEQARHGMMPARAIDLLTMGESGTVHLGWRNGSQEKEATISRGKTTVAPITEANGALSIKFYNGADLELAKRIQGKSQVTLDLRNSGKGDIETMRKCLAQLMPTGTFGFAANERTSGQKTLTIDRGAQAPPQVTIIADNTTRGAAEIFALALSNHAGAKLTGSEMANDRSIVESVELQNGSGYTLVTGVYRPIPATKGAAH